MNALAERNVSQQPPFKCHSGFFVKVTCSLKGGGDADRFEPAEDIQHSIYRDMKIRTFRFPLGYYAPTEKEALEIVTYINENQKAVVDETNAKAEQQGSQKRITISTAVTPFVVTPAYTREIHAMIIHLLKTMKSAFLVGDQTKITNDYRFKFKHILALLPSGVYAEAIRNILPHFEKRNVKPEESLRKELSYLIKKGDKPAQAGRKLNLRVFDEAIELFEGADIDG